MGCDRSWFPTPHETRVTHSLSGCGKQVCVEEEYVGCCGLASERPDMTARKGT